MYLISAYSHNAAQLTKERKQQIRRNEQICQEQYEPPTIFRLVKVGKTRVLEQGDTVVGKVKVVTTKKIACQVIFVEFSGVVKVDFNVPSTTMIDEIQNFQKEWKFFSHKIPVFMHEQRGYNFLEPGIYEFYFKARVPIGGPCTFLTDIASVTYSFSGVFVRNDVTTDINSENHLTYHVRGYKDLNPYDGARIGFWQQKITRVGGICGMLTGQVDIRVKTDKRAFVPGEKIHIIGEVSNNTWRLCTFHYELIQNVKMWGEHYFWRSDKWGSRHLKDQLVMEKGEGRVIHPGDKITLEETLLIPKGIEPSYLGMTARDFINDLINLEYRLKFEVDIPYSANLRLVVPIVIGTEPYIFLPTPPHHNTKDLVPDSSRLSDIMDLEYELKGEIMDLGKHDPFIIPRFHPLSRSFQKKFPETFLKPRDDGGRKNHRKTGTGKVMCDCDCKKHSKKRHRSTCQKMVADLTKGKKSRKVRMDFGNGLPLEECTYSNWLAASIEEYLDDDGRQTNMLLNVMKQYGLIA